MPSPNPIAFQDLITPDNVEQYKKTNCRRYLHCMNIASRQSWQQFACIACELNEEAVFSAAEIQTAARLGKALAKLPVLIEEEDEDIADAESP